MCTSALGVFRLDRHGLVDAGASVSHEFHRRAHLVITDSQIGHLQSTPARLLLSDRKTFCRAHDLAHAGVTEEVWMDWCWLASGTIRRTPQRQHAHVGSLRGGTDNLPRL